MPFRRSPSRLAGQRVMAVTRPRQRERFVTLACACSLSCQGDEGLRGHAVPRTICGSATTNPRRSLGHVRAPQSWTHHSSSFVPCSSASAAPIVTPRTSTATRNACVYVVMHLRGSCAASGSVCPIPLPGLSMVATAPLQDNTHRCCRSRSTFAERASSLCLAWRVIALRGEGIDFLFSDRKNADHGGVFRRRCPDSHCCSGPLIALWKTSR